jgi:hypothetical protein
VYVCMGGEGCKIGEVKLLYRSIVGSEGYMKVT